MEPNVSSNQIHMRFQPSNTYDFTTLIRCTAFPITLIFQKLIYFGKAKKIGCNITE